MPPQLAFGFLQGRGEVSHLIAIPEISIHGTDVLAFGLMGVKLRSTHSSAQDPGLRVQLLPLSAASSPPSLPHILF